VTSRHNHWLTLVPPLPGRDREGAEPNYRVTSIHNDPLPAPSRRCAARCSNRNRHISSRFHLGRTGFIPHRQSLSARRSGMEQHTRRQCSVAFGWIASLPQGNVTSPTNCLFGHPYQPSSRLRQQTPATITLAWNASTDDPGGSGVASYDVLRSGQKSIRLIAANRAPDRRHRRRDTTATEWLAGRSVRALRRHAVMAHANARQYPDHERRELFHDGIHRRGKHLSGSVANAFGAAPTAGLIACYCAARGTIA